MQGKEKDEGILSYVEDDDAAMCVSAHRTFAVIFLECYKSLCQIKFCHRNHTPFFFTNDYRFSNLIQLYHNIKSKTTHNARLPHNSVTRKLLSRAVINIHINILLFPIVPVKAHSV